MTVVALGDSFISGEAGRWYGNALNPFLSRAGTDRAFHYETQTQVQEILTEVQGLGLFGWFTDWVTQVVETVVQVPAYDPEIVYGDSQANGCHRSDVAEVNAEIPGVEKHVNLACSGATALRLWFADTVPQAADVVVPPAPGGGEPWKGEDSQIEQLLALARGENPDHGDVQIRLVVLSIGGNDLQFSTIVKGCVEAYALSSAEHPVRLRRRQHRRP